MRRHASRCLQMIYCISLTFVILSSIYNSAKLLLISLRTGNMPARRAGKLPVTSGNLGCRLLSITHAEIRAKSPERQDLR